MALHDTGERKEGERLSKVRHEDYPAGWVAIIAADKYKALVVGQALF